MTYCCGILVRDGMVMIADTRTNAGLDNISTFRKLHVFRAARRAGDGAAPPPATCRSASRWSACSTRASRTRRAAKPHTLMNAPTMFQAAQRIGDAIRRVHHIEGPALEAADVKFDVSFLFGGQIKGDKLRLYMIYSAGNFIECTVDTPYLQIGEHKYGKPILDRAVRYGIDIYDGLKIALLSMDSTLRSNLGVGMPIDVAVVRRDVCDAELIYRIEPGDAYFHDLQRTLVGGAAGRPYRHSAPALRHAALNPRLPFTSG